MNHLLSRRRTLVLSLLVLLAFVPSSLFSLFGDGATETASRMQREVKYLASDELEGRGVGTEGLDQAAEFVKGEFAQAGLDVERLDGNGYQTFRMTTGTRLGQPNTLQWTGPDGTIVDLEYDKDFRTCSFGSSGQFEGDIVFAGYGIDASKQHYNDFDGIDVKGKVVIVMRRTPQQGNPDSPFAAPHGGISRHADLRSKVSVTFGRGAAALVFVSDPYTSRNNAEKTREHTRNQVIAAAEKLVSDNLAKAQEPAASTQPNLEPLAAAVKRLQSAREAVKRKGDDPLMKFGYGGNGSSKSIPIVQITQTACNRLLKACRNKTLEQIEAQIDADLKPRSAVLTGWKAKGTTTVIQTRSAIKNVIGVLEGEGPLADETIVIGAHYDHLGLGGPGSLAHGSNVVHNGADDNASGTVCLIELARRLAHRGKKLPRRLVFIAFTGEERGLVGSAHYVKEPLVPLNKTIAMFNLDMVGRLRNDKLTVFGTGTAKRWKPLIETLGKKHGFQLTLKPGGFGPSDQSSFYTKKIPVLHFFTGTHSDYHRPSDDWEKVNIDGMLRVSDLIEEVILGTAETSDRPKYIALKRSAPERRNGDRPYFGSIPDFGTEVPGYAISGVAPGSPADKAGLKGGDSIIQFGEQKIGDLSDFDLALRRHVAGDTVELVVFRDGEHVKLTVTLDKPR